MLHFSDAYFLSSECPLRSAGVDPYPQKFKVAISITDYVAKYNSLGAGRHLLTASESLAGIDYFYLKVTVVSTGKIYLCYRKKND